MADRAWTLMTKLTAKHAGLRNGVGAAAQTTAAPFVGDAPTAPPSSTYRR